MAPEIIAAGDVRSVLEEDLSVNLEAVAVVSKAPLGPFNEAPLEVTAIPGKSIVSEMTCNPAETAFLKTAQGASYRILEGLSLFVGPGAVQFRLFTGRSGPPRSDASHGAGETGTSVGGLMR